MDVINREAKSLQDARKILQPLQKSIFCGADFGCAMSLDLQQKLKAFPTFFKWQQWRRQKIFIGGIHSVPYGGHLQWRF